MERRSALACLALSAAGLAPPLAARPATAGSPAARFALLPLVGRQLDIVSFRESVGSRTDGDDHAPLRDPDGQFDRVAAQGLAAALRRAWPESAADALDADLPDVVAATRDAGAGDVLALPPADARDIASGGTTHLLLVLPWRASLQVSFRSG